MKSVQWVYLSGFWHRRVHCPVKFTVILSMQLRCRRQNVPMVSFIIARSFTCSFAVLLERPSMISTQNLATCCASSSGGGGCSDSSSSVCSCDADNIVRPIHLQRRRSDDDCNLEAGARWIYGQFSPASCSSRWC